MKKERKIKLIDILKKLNFSKKTPAQEKLQIKKNEAIIDMSLKKLEKYVGRKLTEEEETEILEIVDKYTPKNKVGNYLVDLLPFDYAWQIHEAKMEGELDKFIGELEVKLD